MPDELLASSWLNSPLLRKGLDARGRWRLIVHSVFWVFMFLFMIYSYSWSVTDMLPILLLATGSTIVISSSYYFIESFGLPLFYKKQWIPLLVVLIGLYFVHTVYNYYSFLWVADRYQVFTKVIGSLGEKGIWYALRQRTTLLINWSFTFAPLTIPVAIKLVKDILQTRVKAAELERDNVRLELQFLQAQIQPHFVLNSINSVYSIVAGVDDEAATMLLRLSALLRYALHETANPSVSLTREVEFLQEYIGLEAVRQHERTTLSFQHDGSTEGFYLPPLLLVTFVENAFKHGINATYRQAWADIRLQISDDGTLSFRVENSKPPAEIRRGGKPKKTGIGLENTRRRLNLLFPGRHQLVIQNEVETFTIDLTLQLKRVNVVSAVPW